MIRKLISGVAVVALLGCGESGPTAGDLTFTLNSANADAAVQFRVTATAPNTISSVSAACAGCKMFQAKISDGEYRGVVTGNIASGPLLRVGVSDTGAKSAYSAAVVAVAAPDYQLRVASGYSLTLPAKN